MHAGKLVWFVGCAPRELLFNLNITFFLVGGIKLYKKYL